MYKRLCGLGYEETDNRNYGNRYEVLYDRLRGIVRPATRYYETGYEVPAMRYCTTGYEVLVLYDRLRGIMRTAMW